MKIIFLDFDGVMNPPNGFLVFHEPWKAEFGKRAVENLNYILEQTGAYVVVCATMRGDHRWSIDLFHYNGIDPGKYLSFTPSLSSRIRGEEIKKWIDIHRSAIESFVIIDDDGNFDIGEDLLPYTVIPKYQDALTRSDAEKAIQILKGGLPNA